MSAPTARILAKPPNLPVTTAVLLLSSLTVMANATISPALPGIREHFAGVSGIETIAGLILTLPSLAVVLSAGLWGSFADKFNRQTLLITAGVLYAAGGASGLWTNDLAGMLIGRFVLGVGVAGTMVLATTWAADLWQGQARSQFLGLQGAAMSAGGILVMLSGGALASLHWRGAFATYLLVVPVTVFALWALAPSENQRTMMQLRHGSTVASSISETFPWHAFAFVGTLGFLFMSAFYVVPTRLPFLLGEVGVSNPLVLGAIISLMTVSAFPGALAFGRIRGRFSALAIFALSWFLMGLGALILSMATSLPMMALGVVVVGLGLGPAMPNYIAYLMAAVSPSSRGRASGLLTAAFFAGQFSSPIVLAPLVSLFGLRGAFLAMAFLQLALACALTIATALQNRRA
jgi:MFS family permease